MPLTLEYRLKLKDDICRSYQVHKETVNPDHPCRFPLATGKRWRIETVPPFAMNSRSLINLTTVPIDEVFGAATRPRWQCRELSQRLFRQYHASTRSASNR